MSNHEAPSVERHCDVAVVGGSAAGLAAALQLGRQRRSVIVVDSGEPRNAPAAHTHGFLGRDGSAPGELTGAGREEVRRYGGEILAGRVTRVTRTSDGRFGVEVGGHLIVARRALAATGVVDRLPDIEGLADHWGGDVVHCPFCHGYEIRDRRVVQVISHPSGLHTVALFRQLTDRLTIVLPEPGGVDDGEVEALRAGGVDVRRGRVVRVVGGPDGHVVAVEVAGGERIDADAVAVGPQFSARVEPFASLGLEPAVQRGGLGELVETDAAGQTAVAGLYAAGNVTDPSQQLLQAAASGAHVGAMISFSLAEEDLRAAARPSANQADWDHRYGGAPIWSGNPNGSLVAEVAEVGGLAAGRALDVGAGEGGDAVWLAEQGWQVTATDISDTALGRVAAEAARRGLPIECRRADADAFDPYGGQVFDLVSAQYASIPRTPDDRAVHNLLAAVAPGGTLLVVSHDLGARRHTPDGAHGRPVDPDAYVRTDDVAAVLSATPGWDIEVHATRPRPPGAVSAAHHGEDIVLRARRRAS